MMFVQFGVQQVPSNAIGCKRAAKIDSPELRHASIGVELIGGSLWLHNPLSVRSVLDSGVLVLIFGRDVAVAIFDVRRIDLERLDQHCRRTESSPLFVHNVAMRLIMACTYNFHQVGLQKRKRRSDSSRSSLFASRTVAKHGPLHMHLLCT
jgi:hypothetical protein